MNGCITGMPLSLSPAPNTTKPSAASSSPKSANNYNLSAYLLSCRLGHRRVSPSLSSRPRYTSPYTPPSSLPSREDGYPRPSVTLSIAPAFDAGINRQTCRPARTSINADVGIFYVNCVGYYPIASGDISAAADALLYPTSDKEFVIYVTF